jgi:hypothetical protein
MIRPGVTLTLWLAIAVLVIVNNIIADTFVVSRLSVLAGQWYKVLVPLPYVVLMAAIHARRTAGPRWLDAALLAALLWPPSTVAVDFAYEHLTFGEEAISFIERFAFWWAAPYPLLVVVLFAAPLVAGRLSSSSPFKWGGGP